METQANPCTMTGLLISLLRIVLLFLSGLVTGHHALGLFFLSFVSRRMRARSGIGAQTDRIERKGKSEEKQQ
ncbi:MAG: hypothetical protein KJ017_07930 [Alphaproteobacteria bacterium]|nr:hypothetical protein [Alphaproteobacteria bacterium]